VYLEGRGVMHLTFDLRFRSLKVKIRITANGLSNIIVLQL